MNNLGVLALQKQVRTVDVFPGPGAEAGVVHSYASLDEAFAGMFGVATADSHACAAADIVDVVLTGEHALQAKKGQELLIKGSAAIPFAHGQVEVCHSIDFDHVCRHPCRS